MIDKLGGGGVDVLAPPPQFDSKTISIQTKLIRIGGRNIFSAVSLRSGSLLNREWHRGGMY